MNRTYIMGILNVTPDSFSDGNEYFDADKAVERAIEMKNQGADIIDIGGQSTRPGYEKVSPEKEWKRIKDVIKRVRKKINLPISVDTFYASVAKNAIDSGADIINDVSGFQNREMFEIAKSRSCGCVVMSCVSLKRTKSFFKAFLKNAEYHKINKENICFDPGIGFNKSYSENLKIIRDVKEYCPEGYPILVGASRKRVVAGPNSDLPFKERLAGSIAAHTLSIAGGANIIRVHDVKESLQAIKLVDAVLKERF